MNIVILGYFNHDTMGLATKINTLYVPQAEISKIQNFGGGHFEKWP